MPPTSWAAKTAAALTDSHLDAAAARSETTSPNWLNATQCDADTGDCLCYDWYDSLCHDILCAAAVAAGFTVPDPDAVGA
jgi:hypothetical protein